MEANENGEMVLQSELLARAGFAHAFSTRRGGVSVAPYATLDFALLRDPVALAENTTRLARAVGFDPKRLHQANQVHGDGVAVITTTTTTATSTSTSTLPTADALVSRVDGEVVGVRIADCVPILVGDTITGHVAAIHAGWKGIVGGVTRAALDALGGNRAELVAAIGPCIGTCCFEVSEEVAERIAKALTDRCIATRHISGKAMVDLRAAAAAQLEAAGLLLSRVEQVPGCTKCEPSRFYSFRRDGDAAGRLIAVIAAR